MPLEQGGKVINDSRQLGAQGGERELVQLVSSLLQPAEQDLLLRHSQLRAQAGTGRGGELAGHARVMQPLGLHLNRRDAFGAPWRAILREHDLVGHSGQVEFVRLLVQVVLPGEVAGVEEVADVGRLTVAVSLLRVVRELLGDRQRCQLAGIGQVVVRVPRLVALAWRCHPAQGEERGEELVEHLVVAAVLDQSEAERLTQRLSVGQHAWQGGSPHRIRCLRDRNPQPEQAEQADEAMKAVVHGPASARPPPGEGRERP